MLFSDWPKPAYEAGWHTKSMSRYAYLISSLSEGVHQGVGVMLNHKHMDVGIRNP